MIESKNPKDDRRTPETDTGLGFRGDPFPSVTPFSLDTSNLLHLFASLHLWMIDSGLSTEIPSHAGSNNPGGSTEMIAFIDAVWLGNKSKTTCQPSESACFPEPHPPLVSAPVLIFSYFA